MLAKQLQQDRVKPIDIMSHYDPLTDLYNRDGFIQQLQSLIDNETPLVMFYLDIDNFKNINAPLGRHIGDGVIKEIAFRLQKLLPAQTILGYLGGDEFSIILPSPKPCHTVESLAQRISSLINQPFDLQHFSKRLTCSMGCTVFPGDGDSAVSLLQNADIAMHEAKNQGRNRLFKYQTEMSEEAHMRLWLETELQKALQQHDLEVWYQPKVDAHNFSINGAEALIRWKHSDKGHISPVSFIPIAEKTGLIEHLGQMVIREVFTTVKHWKNKGILPGRIAINLSPKQLSSPKLIDYIKKQLQITELDPNCITFEITESAMMDNCDHTIQILKVLQDIGFTLSVDDFGTGYSSLSYLARFPVDELKIDRAFIKDIGKLPKQNKIIKHIIDLGHSLDLNVIAEGVEEQQQAILLSDLNCHSIQGFYFHKPQPKSDIEKLFAAHSGSPE